MEALRGGRGTYSGNNVREINGGKRKIQEGESDK